MIGDGSKIMMCDFYFGHFYGDIIANPRSWMTAQEKVIFKAQFPKFEKFGQMFVHEAQNWLKRREAIGQTFGT